MTLGVDEPIDDSAPSPNEDVPIVRKPLAVAFGVALFVVVVALAYPGLYSPDTVLIVWQGRGEAPRTSWQPQVLVQLWRLIAQLSGSVAAIFLVQTALFGVAGYQLVRLARRRSGAIAASVLLVLPPVLAMVVSMWKDTQLGLIWLIVSCLAIRYDGTRRQTAGLVACALAIAVIRHNSPFLALLPIMLIVDVERHRLPRSWARLPTVAIAFVLMLVLGGAGLLSGRALSTRELHPENVGMSWDIVGAGIRSGHVDLPPSTLRDPPCTIDEYTAQYTARTSDFLVFPEEACVDLVLAEEYDEQLNGPTSRISLGEWLGSLGESPAGYLEHRLAVGMNLLGLEGVPPGLNSYQSAPSAAGFVNIELRPVTVEVLRFVRWSTGPLALLHLPVVWLAASLFGLFGIVDPFRRRRAALIVGTMMFNLVITAILVPASDVRYSYPLLITAMVVTTLAFDRSGGDRRHDADTAPADERSVTG